MKSVTEPYKRQLVYSQIALFLTLLVCIVISPASLADNGGISYFGHHKWTVAPFELGLFIADYFLLLAERAIRGQKRLAVLRVGLLIIIPSVAGIALAPATGNGWLDDAHRFFGTITFLTELGLGLWLASMNGRDAAGWLLLGLQAAGGLIALIYLSPARGFSIQGQVLFLAAFAVLLLRRLPLLPEL